MASTAKIKPRTLKGFRDYLPDTMIVREHIIDIARRVYRSYGFSPIDTPALEYLEILEGKGSDETDRQMYRFQDHGGRWVGLRFDLTVPLARFVAQHIDQLGTPFKRYHIGTVWRGENTQRGRYREFVQCDFDTIGTAAITADIETALVIHDLLKEIGFERFTIRINNRKVLTGLLEKLGVADRATPILRVLDKLAKIGPQQVHEQLQSVAGLTSQQADQLMKLTQLQGKNETILQQLEPLVSGNETGQLGVQQLREVIAGVKAAGVSEEFVQLDVSIARGLDYYTGTVYETFLSDLPGIGSVCSGGRYDNLAELYINRQLPGVGASLGLDRLIAAMEELNMLQATSTPAQVFIPYFDANRLHDYLALAAHLRNEGLAVEFYPEPKKLGQQLKYADRRGFRVAVIVGEDEFAAGKCQLKNLATKQQLEVPLDDRCQQLAEAIRKELQK